jgi:hypothetical protein
MKRALVIWIFVAFTVSPLWAQEEDAIPGIALEFTDVTLKEALDLIAVHFKLRMSYSDSKINSTRNVSGRYSATSQQDFLSQFLNDQELNYTIIDDQIVIFPFNSNQTIKISGRVTGAEDGEPVAFASVTLPDATKGTSTNEDGEFELDVTELPTQITVSHIAYEKQMIFVYEYQSILDVRLKQAPRQLKELTIKSRRDKNAYYQLLKNARGLISEKRDEWLYGKAFYRQKSERQDRYTEIFEMFYDVKYTRNGIADWALQEGRYAFQNKDEYDVFLYNKNFTLLSRMFSLLQPATESYLLPFHPDARDIFELSLSEVIEYEGRHIAIINYMPFTSVDKPAARGKIYIDFETSEVFKMTGTFTDGSMNVIGFSDSQSSWDDYQLSFDISFGENDSGGLKLDYIRVDHHFNYYYNKEFIGKIHTSSFLSFYEHYIPAITKRLGGPVDFKTSDTETIDLIGYNREFWLQNPVVKRTPLEEKLILDFDKNQAFGMVFLNQEEQVILLPDRKNSEKARKIIEGYEQASDKSQQHRIYLQLDKTRFQPTDKIRFAGYIVDPWTLRPSVTGSVLNISLTDNTKVIVAAKSYDINHGVSYGEIDLTGMRPGLYLICANLNTDTTCLFKRQIAILSGEPIIKSADPVPEPAIVTKMVAAPEGGLLLADTRSKVIIAGYNDDDEIVPTACVVTDDSGSQVSLLNMEPDGLEELIFVPQSGKSYYLQQSGIDNATRWPLQPVVTEGILLTISDRDHNSLGMEIHQKPAFPREVYILSASAGKVFSVYEKKLTGITTIIDLPTQHLPPGINDLVLSDAHGNILASRQIFVEPASLNIEYKSGVWKSRKNQKLELTFRVTNMTGEPNRANLSAVCSQDAGSVYSELTTGLLFANNHIPTSQLQLIPRNEGYDTADKLLVLNHEFNQKKSSTRPTLHDAPAADLVMEDKIIAEVSVSAISDRPIQRMNRGHENHKMSMAHETIWLPKLLISQDGIAVLDVQANPGAALVIAIQGLSHHGEIADFREVIHLDNLKDQGIKKVNRNQ